TVFLPELPGDLHRVARHPSELLDGLGVRLEWLPGGEARGQDCPAVSARSSGRVALAVLTTPDKTESTAVDVRDGDAVGRRFLAQGREPGRHLVEVRLRDREVQREEPALRLDLVPELAPGSPGLIDPGMLRRRHRRLKLIQPEPVVLPDEV